MPPPLWVRGMGGMGDCAYQRPIIRHLCAQRGRVWLSTPWPELYTDLPVIPVHWATLELRCQLKNMARQPEGTYQPPPNRPELMRIGYALRAMTATTISEEMEKTVGVSIPRASFRFDLPSFSPPPVRFRRPYAVIRPVTVRQEWMNHARNPEPEYIAQAAQELSRRGFAVICVADIDGTREWATAPLPVADRYLVRGELDLPRLMALVQGASVVVGGVGWIVPTTLAMKRPAVIISGGLGAHNAPEVLVDRRMDASRMRFVLPEPYCRCREPRHACSKVIPDFAAKLAAALDAVLP